MGLRIIIDEDTPYRMAVVQIPHEDPIELSLGITTTRITAEINGRYQILRDGETQGFSDAWDIETGELVEIQWR